MNLPKIGARCCGKIHIALKKMTWPDQEFVIICNGKVDPFRTV
jgi:hypothetical protein